MSRIAIRLNTSESHKAIFISFFPNFSYHLKNQKTRTSIVYWKMCQTTASRKMLKCERNIDYLNSSWFGLNQNGIQIFHSEGNVFDTVSMECQVLSHFQSLLWIWLIPDSKITDMMKSLFQPIRIWFSIMKWLLSTSISLVRYRIDLPTQT